MTIAAEPTGHYHSPPTRLSEQPTTHSCSNCSACSATHWYYMGGVSAVISGDNAVPIGLLLVLPLPAIGLMNLVIRSLLQWLGRHWYIQKLGPARAP